MRLLRLLNRRAQTREVPGAQSASRERARRLLVSTLYGHPLGLTAGSLAGLGTSVIAALEIRHPLYTALTVLFAAIAAIRIVAAFRLSPDRDEMDLSTLEGAYRLGAYSFALLFGLLAGLALAARPHHGVVLLIVANALCYGMGMCARNAGRPRIALNQLALTYAPIVAGALYLRSFEMLVLAVTLLLVGPIMASITVSISRTLRESIAAADTSDRLARRMETLALSDVVTGLANRAGLNRALIEALSRRPADRQLAMLWLDLDRFKEVNDLNGHQFGDRVLAEVASRLKGAVNAQTHVARFGGDEFVLFREVASRAEAQALATRVVDQFTTPLAIGKERLRIGTSAGVALLPADAKDADSLLKAADLALYHSKVEGRGGVHFFNPAMTRQLAHRRELEEELRGALQRNELSVFFQPIVDLATGRIRCFEALVRWFHPRKGELPPTEFIPVAEQTGLIVTLGNWITREAAKAAAGWPADVTIAVNLSPLQIRAPGAALGIKAALRDAGLDPARLILEVTESLFLEDCPTTDDFIGELSAIGVRFAIDDFGTGFSSLGYINKYPFSKIKVDRSFVSGPQAGPKANAIIRAVAELGARLNMEIVAEGIETTQQAEIQREAGCTLGQGYYYSRAVPDYLAATLLANHSALDHRPVMRTARAG